jgi:uncharacterized membrane protein YidH (DUF202 family)
MPSAADDLPGDPGLARERTSMAWQRMALGFTSLGALVLGLAAHRNTPWMVLPAAALFAVGTAIGAYWRRRAARGAVGVQPAALRWLTAATVITAAVAAVLTVVRPG